MMGRNSKYLKVQTEELHKNSGCEISVVMPVYNTPVPFLKDAVDSILSQTYKDFEFIIIDDGSSEKETLDYLDNLTDPRIRVLHNEKNIGVTKSLNRGLRAVSDTCRYIARMDADDISVPDRLEKQYAFMEANPDVIVCGSYISVKSGDEVKPPKKMKKQDPEMYRIIMLFVFAGPHHPTAFIRRDVLLQHHVEYNEELPYSQDYYLWMQLSNIGKIVRLPECFVTYRLHDEQITVQHRTGQFECNKVTQRELLTRLLGEVSEEELDLHFRYSTGYYRGLKVTKEVIKWYRKLIRANDKKRIYSRIKFRRRICRIIIRDMVWYWQKKLKG